MRAMGVVEPPGGYGTMNFTGLVGHATCATAANGAIAAHATAQARAALKRLGLITVSLRLGELLAHVGLIENLDELGVELVDDGLGRAGGCENAPPSVSGKSTEPLLSESRHVGHHLRALLSGDAERAQLP